MNNIGTTTPNSTPCPDYLQPIAHALKPLPKRTRADVAAEVALALTRVADGYHPRHKADDVGLGYLVFQGARWRGFCERISLLAMLLHTYERSAVWCVVMGMLEGRIRSDDIWAVVRASNNRLDDGLDHLLDDLGDLLSDIV